MTTATFIQTHPHRLKCFLIGALGLLPTLLGAAMVLYIYAFASIVDPQLSREARRRAILESMFFSAAAVPLAFGVALMAAGIVTMIYFFGAAAGFIRIGLSRRAIWRIAGIGAVAMLLFFALI